VSCSRIEMSASNGDRGQVAGYATWPLPLASAIVTTAHSNTCPAAILCLNSKLRGQTWLEASRNVMAHAQKSYFVFRRNGRVHLNRPEGVSSVDYWQPRCAHQAVVVLDTPCSEVVWRVLATQSIRQFPLYFPSRASPCAIIFQLNCTYMTVRVE